MGTNWKIADRRYKTPYDVNMKGSYFEVSERLRVSGWSYHRESDDWTNENDQLSMALMSPDSAMNILIQTKMSVPDETEISGFGLDDLAASVGEPKVDCFGLYDFGPRQYMLMKAGSFLIFEEQFEGMPPKDEVTRRVFRLHTSLYDECYGNAFEEMDCDTKTRYRIQLLRRLKEGGGHCLPTADVVDRWYDEGLTMIDAEQAWRKLP